MHVSVTPELERIVKDKEATGLFNNASEVIREALRFIQTNDELIRHMKLESLRPVTGVTGEVTGGGNRGEVTGDRPRFPAYQCNRGLSPITFQCNRGLSPITFSRLPFAPGAWRSVPSRR
jgi:putative addiction module CopG family antidote